MEISSTPALRRTGKPERLDGRAERRETGTPGWFPAPVERPESTPVAE